MSISVVPAPEDPNIKKTFSELFERANKEMLGITNPEIKNAADEFVAQYNASAQVREYLNNVTSVRMNLDPKKRKDFSGEANAVDTPFCKRRRAMEEWFKNYSARK